MCASLPGGSIAHDRHYGCEKGAGRTAREARPARGSYLTSSTFFHCSAVRQTRSPIREPVMVSLRQIFLSAGLLAVDWSESALGWAVAGAEQMRKAVTAAKEIKRMAFLPIDIPRLFYLEIMTGDHPPAVDWQIGGRSWSKSWRLSAAGPGGGCWRGARACRCGRDRDAG